MSLLVSFLLIQAAANAPAGDAQASTPEDDAKRVCKTVTVTGSRLGGKRVCMTKKEWRRMNEESERAAREIQDTYSKQPGAQ